MESQPPEPAVRVSLQAIYDTLIELKSTMDKVAEWKTEAAKDLVDHEGRLRGLERRRWPIPSLAVVTSMIALIVSAVGALWRKP